MIYEHHRKKSPLAAILLLSSIIVACFFAPPVPRTIFKSPIPNAGPPAKTIIPKIPFVPEPRLEPTLGVAGEK